MKNFIRVKDKIKLLSDVTGLPVRYASDLNIIFECLESYDGNRFLLILRTSGAQLCLLDKQSNEYRAQKLSEFAIDPIEALKKIAHGHELATSIKDISVQ